MSFTFSYFTVIGPRTVLYEKDYKFYVTNKYDGRSMVSVAIEALKTGEEIEKIWIPLNFNSEKQYRFNVLNFNSYQLNGFFQ